MGCNDRAGSDLPDRPLYKYLSLRPGQDPGWQDRVALLLAGGCYLSSAADFNDPFDCLPYISRPDDPRERAEWSEGVIAALADTVRHDVPAAFAQEWIRQKLEAFSAQDIDARLQEAAVQNASKMGVFCLAECIDSVLMWSHYADNHRGIALQFDVRREPDGELMPLWKVAYRKQRPIITDFYKPNPSLPLADALAIKASFWEYEQEWRAMKPDRARHVVRFDPNVITGLVLGANCTAENEQILRSLIAARPVTVYRMKPDQVTFDLSMVPA